MWGYRVKIPAKLQKGVLDELHEEGDVGIVKMKALARSYMWWHACIDESIEGMAKTCSGCQLIPNNPKNAPLHPWDNVCGYNVFDCCGCLLKMAGSGPHDNYEHN
jgi:hypothetical protein